MSEVNVDLANLLYQKETAWEAEKANMVQMLYQKDLLIAASKQRALELSQALQEAQRKVQDMAVENSLMQQQIAGDQREPLE